MDRYTYTLNQKNRQEKPLHYYTREQLDLMTTYQLRDICWKEQILKGIQAPLDNEELIRQILRFRGRKENLYIRGQNDEGLLRLEELLHTAVIHANPQA